jgi:hypothetical protein
MQPVNEDIEHKRFNVIDNDLSLFTFLAVLA